MGRALGIAASLSLVFLPVGVEVSLLVLSWAFAVRVMS
jgi:hypothetical protein